MFGVPADAWAGFLIDALSVFFALLVVAYSVGACLGVLRKLTREVTSGPPPLPYGMGPTGVARRTVPSLHGLEVRVLH